MSMLHHAPLNHMVITNHWGAPSAYNDNFHDGVDFAAPVGTPIFATHDGKIRKAEFQETGFGWVVVVENEELETTYAHCSKILVNPGNVVHAGDVIALVGNSGDSHGAHLHFGLRIKPWSYGGKYNGYSNPNYALKQLEKDTHELERTIH